MEYLNKITDRLFVSLQRVCEHPQGVSGLSTGFEALDKLTSGWHKGELIVITSPPRMGKTALALSMLNNSMYDDRLGTIWFSTNLAAMQLTKMMLCNNLGVEMQHLQRGKVDAEILLELIEKYAFSGLLVDDTPYLSIDDIDSKIDDQFLMCPVEMIVIDDVNNLNYSKTDMPDLADKLYQLKALARKYEIAVVVLMETENPPCGMSSQDIDCISLSDYKALSKSVDVTIQLCRPGYYKVIEFSDKSSTLGMAELICSGRNGYGKVRLQYEPEFFRFKDIYM